MLLLLSNLKNALTLSNLTFHLFTVNSSSLKHLTKIIRDFLPKSYNLAENNEMGESTSVPGKPVDFGSGRSMSIQAMQALFELKENNQLCDATIVLDDGSEIPVHRAILCACSSYFK